VVSYTDRENASLPSHPVRDEIFREQAGYVLRLDYPDPFLEEQTIRKPSVPKNPAVSSLPEGALVPEFPDIRFKGVIRQSKKRYAILETESHSDLLQQGDVLENWQLSGITADSVILKKGKHTLVLKPQ
jgi:hypothetical protein